MQYLAVELINQINDLEKSLLEAEDHDLNITDVPPEWKALKNQIAREIEFRYELLEKLVRSRDLL